ncbi:multicopper oxidase family protein [soil metagenome]
MGQTHTIATMHRRTILRAALAAPTLFVRRPGGSIRSPGMPGQLFCDLTSTPYAGTNPVIVPPPFSVALPIPPELSGPDISLRAAPAEVELIPGMSTRVLAYDGTFPGPTIVARPDEETNIELINAHDDSLVVHLHGGHTPAAFDGHPFDTIAPGESFTYRYPNRQSPATLWYHDHGMMTTASNVYHGLAGLYLLRDPTETALGLPVGGPADIPLVLTDKTFDDDGQLVYPQGQHDGFFGDVPLVTGAPHPLGAVPSGLVRLRILNASNARAYQIHRSDGIALLQIASDGGLLAEPVLRPVIELWPAERVEVLLDLQDAADGEEVTLVDGLQFREGLVRFVVSGRQDSAAPPLSLRGPLELDEPTVIRDFSLGFDQTTSTWLLNGHDFDVDILDATPRLGEVERWRFTNTAPGSHPMHLHQTSFIVRARKSATKNPLPLEAGDVGWKDTVVVRQGQTVEVDVRFDDFPGTYVYHCHILEHEDHGMMSQFRVLPTTRLAGTSRVDTAIAASKYTHPDGAQSVVVASGETFADALAAGPVARALEGPLLLVTGQTLPASVEEEIRRLAPARIIVAGGIRAVPPTTATALEQLAPTERVAGGSREATAVAVSWRAFKEA